LQSEAAVHSSKRGILVKEKLLRDMASLETELTWIRLGVVKHVGKIREALAAAAAAAETEDKGAAEKSSARVCMGKAARDSLRRPSPRRWLPSWPRSGAPAVTTATSR